MTNVAAIEARMANLIHERTTSDLTKMYSEAQCELRAMARITEHVTERAAFRRVLTMVGDELFKRGFIMCWGCTKWQNDHPNGSCFKPTRPAAERIHLRLMLDATGTGAQLRAARTEILKGMTPEQLLAADRDACDEGQENRRNGATKLDKDQLVDTRDLIDNELNARGYDYCFHTRKFEPGHDLNHCL